MQDPLNRPSYEKLTRKGVLFELQKKNGHFLVPPKTQKKPTGKPP